MRRSLPILLLLVCAAGFAFAVIRLFQLRFAAGDVYPPYSSLRADPLGTMALYESLGKLPGLSVRRDFTTSNVLPDEPNTVYLHLAGDRDEWDTVPDDLYHELKAFLARGGRLVITLSPETAPTNNSRGEPARTNAAAPPEPVDKRMTPRRPVRQPGAREDTNGFVSLTEKWGFHLQLKGLLASNSVFQPATVANKTDLALPPVLEWHSALVLTNLDQPWRVIYARGTNAVLAERLFNQGSVVLATDSYFVSNEAMAKDRHAELLGWLLGPNRHMVFDEAHFGITQTSGVAALMWKYRLGGLAAGLALLAGLFIWQHATGLVPPRAGETAANVVAGRDAAAGFVNLLRRSIAPRDLLAICFAEWKQAVAQRGGISESRLRQAEAVFSAPQTLPGQGRNPVEIYNKISETVALRTQKP